MIEYPSIDNVFKRDETTHKIIMGRWTQPEFEYLAPCKWIATEKVDGMNIRVCWYPNGQDIGIAISDHPGEPVLQFKGRTDKAQLAKSMVAKLTERFPVDLMMAVFPSTEVCLYGEGYGAGIQKGGKYIPNGVDFALFDIHINHYWLQDNDRVQIAARMDIDVVPYLGTMTIYEAINWVSDGVASHYSGDPTDPFLVEGLVLKPAMEIHTRHGHRIMTKIKTRDFLRYV